MKKAIIIDKAACRVIIGNLLYEDENSYRVGDDEFSMDEKDFKEALHRLFKFKRLDINEFLDDNKKISNQELYEASREILERTMNKLYKWQEVDNKTGELMYKSYELGREHEKKIRDYIRDYIKENK